MSIVINGMDMPKGNSAKNLLIYSDGRVFTGHKDDINYFAEELPPTQLGTMAVIGYPIDADYLMAKVAEEYGERARDALYRIIRYMPPAQPERKSGKWKLLPNGNALCSECGYMQVHAWDAESWDNYCHHCGADMRGEVNGRVFTNISKNN